MEVQDKTRSSPGDGAPGRWPRLPAPVLGRLSRPQPLNRLTTVLRLFTIIPIAILLAPIEGGGFGANAGGTGARYAGGRLGLLVVPALLMILFRQKYPRWWFDWNLELMRFTARVGVYFALMDDRYPSTDEHQAVHLDFPYPDADTTSTAGCRSSSGCWRSLTTWCCSSSTSPRFFVVIAAWFAILFTGRYPPALFDYIVGVGRWTQPRRRLRLPPRHRPLPAIQPAGLTVCRFRFEQTPQRDGRGSHTCSHGRTSLSSLVGGSLLSAETRSRRTRRSTTGRLRAAAEPSDGSDVLVSTTNDNRTPQSVDAGGFSFGCELRKQCAPRSSKPPDSARCTTPASKTASATVIA